jgi:hypothetical protein
LLEEKEEVERVMIDEISGVWSGHQHDHHARIIIISTTGKRTYSRSGKANSSRKWIHPKGQQDSEE